jgi:hypothetical protein
MGEREFQKSKATTIRHLSGLEMELKNFPHDTRLKVLAVTTLIKKAVWAEKITDDQPPVCEQPFIDSLRKSIDELDDYVRAVHCSNNLIGVARELRSFLQECINGKKLWEELNG